MIGICEHQLADAKFIKKPKHRVKLDLDFIYPPALKKVKRLVEKSSQRKKTEQKAPEMKETGVDEQGRKQYKIPEGPVDEEAKNEAHEKKVICFQTSYICKSSQWGHSGGIYVCI